RRGYLGNDGAGKESGRGNGDQGEGMGTRARGGYQGWEPGRRQAAPNRRQVKPSSQASKRREAEGRAKRPAMERPAACLMASQTSRRAWVKDKRRQKPWAKTTT